MLAFDPNFANEVYIRGTMQYMFNRSCSIYSFSRDIHWLNVDIH